MSFSNLLLRARVAFGIGDASGGTCGGRSRVDGLEVEALNWAAYVVVVPDFCEYAVVATEVREGTSMGLQRILHCAKIVGYRVGRDDIGCSKPIIRGKLIRASVRSSGKVVCASYLQPCLGRCLEKVNEVIILLKAWVAFRVEGGEASSMFRIFVSPESGVFGPLGDPIFLHERKEVISTRGCDEGVDGRAGVFGNSLPIDGGWAKNNIGQQAAKELTKKEPNLGLTSYWREKSQ
jgi:hypothetical protein